MLLIHVADSGPHFKKHDFSTLSTELLMKVFMKVEHQMHPVGSHRESKDALNAQININQRIKQTVCFSCGRLVLPPGSDTEVGPIPLTITDIQGGLGNPHEI